MFLPGCVHDTATASSASAGGCRRSARRGRRRVCRESLKEICCAITHTGELLLQRVGVHPARGCTVPAIRPSCSANASTRSSSLSTLGVPAEVVGAVLESRRVALGLRLVIGRPSVLNRHERMAACAHQTISFVPVFVVVIDAVKQRTRLRRRVTAGHSRGRARRVDDVESVAGVA